MSRKAISKSLVLALVATLLVSLVIVKGTGAHEEPESAVGVHDAMVHAGYLDVSTNINDLRAQVGNWEQGNDSGRRIGIEKIDRLNWVIPHVSWPEEMEKSIEQLAEALEPLEDALKAEDLAAAKDAVSVVGSVSHDLTHAFYDRWVASIEGQASAATTHAAYLDVTTNISDLRSQLGNWEQGNDSGRRIGIEKIDRLNWVIPHVSWPEEMEKSIEQLAEALDPLEAALKAEDLAAAKEAVSIVGSISHDLTHAFYDRWMASIEARGEADMVHAGYLDVSDNINDLRAQIGNWEQGNDSGRRIGIEKIDRLGWLTPHIAWPHEMESTIGQLDEALKPVEAALKAEDLDAAKEAVSKVGTISHDLTHAFYDKWVVEQRAGQETVQMPIQGPGAMMEQTPPAMTRAQEMPMAPSMPSPAMSTAPSELVNGGQQVYASKGCSACHGSTGQGGVGPSLTHWHDDATIKSIVRSGAEGMPAFGASQIGDDELTALIAFVQNLATSR
ncbi:MAG: cytochrome c [Chloroflexi bacterium]|nr:cytochrome c [Chloroflexota bacterium]